MSAASALAFAPTPAARSRRARASRLRPPLSRHDGPRRASWHRRLRSPRAAATSADDDRPPRGLGLCPYDTARAGGGPPRRRPPRGRLGRGRRGRRRVISPARARFPSLRARAALGAGAVPTSPRGPTTLAPSSYRPWTGEEVLTPVGVERLRLSPMGLGTWSWGQPVRVGGCGQIHGRTPATCSTAVAAEHQHLRHRGQLRHWKRFRRTFGGVARRISARVSPVALWPVVINIATKFAAYPWRITPNSVVQAARERRATGEKTPSSSVSCTGPPVITNLCRNARCGQASRSGVRRG